LSRIGEFENFPASIRGGFYIFPLILVEKLAGLKEMGYLCAQKGRFRAMMLCNK